MEAESSIAMQGKYIPGVGAAGGGRPTPYDRRARGMRGGRGAGRGRGAGNVKGVMGMYVFHVTLVLFYSAAGLFAILTGRIFQLLVREMHRLSSLCQPAYVAQRAKALGAAVQ